MRTTGEIGNHLYTVLINYRNVVTLKYRNVGVDMDIWLVEANRAGK